MVDVIVDSYNSSNTKILVDGKELNDVVSIDLHVDGDSLPVLNIRLLPHTIKINGNPNVVFNKE